MGFNSFFDAVRNAPVPDNPGRVPNPYLAYAKIWIENGQTKDPKGKPTTNWTEVTMNNNRPQRLLQFEYVRHMPGGNVATVSLFDETWDLVETLVITAEQSRMRWQYGYINGRMSPIYEGTINQYVPTFKIPGVEIQITAYSKGCIQPETGDLQKARVFKDKSGKGLSISDCVVQIATENGWNAVVDSTAPFYGYTDTEIAMKQPRIFLQGGAKDLDYIAGYLAPRAKRLWDNVGGYVMFFEDIVTDVNGTFKPTIHFHPPHFNGDVTNTYTFMRDRQSEILSFSPQVNGVGNLSLGAGSVTTFWMDHQTGEIGSKKFDNSNTPGKQLLGGKITDAVPHDSTTEHANIQTTSKPSIDGDQAKSIGESNYERLFNNVQGATFVIMGNALLEPNSVILIKVILPDGSLHYTSGHYYIMSMTDMIAGGQFTTSMDLTRNTSLEGTKIQKSLGKLTQLAVGKQAQPPNASS